MSIQLSDKDWELLSQWVDGELNDVDARRMLQRMKAEAPLREAADAMRAMDLTLQSALGAHDAVPPAIVRSLGVDDAEAGTVAGGNVVSFPGRNTGNRGARPPRWPLALAASVVAALGVVFLALQPAPQPDGLPGNDALVSATLDTAASGSGWIELNDGRALQPVLTFEHRDGAWCREYLLRSSGSDWRAVACRAADRWVTQAAGLESYLDANGGYRPAGSADSAPVSLFISENAADIALGSEDEQQLIERGWR